MLGLFVLLAATAVPFEDLALLDQKIQEYGKAEAVDRRLKLTRCPEDPIITPAAGGAIIVRCPAIGWRLRVPLRAPDAADDSIVIIIRKGDLIECITSGQGFAVSTQMIALDDASIGQSLRVKSLTSPTPMTAVAKARGVAVF
jgi:flagellar basal body P-ring formation protein FlgA